MSAICNFKEITTFGIIKNVHIFLSHLVLVKSDHYNISFVINTKNILCLLSSLFDLSVICDLQNHYLYRAGIHTYDRSNNNLYTTSLNVNKGDQL